MKSTLLAALVLFAAAAAAAEPAVEFGRDIQPILSDRCYKCHGPDEAKREAELRFDVEASALAVREGKASIKRGDPAGSELVSRILSDDPELRMPPPDSKLVLSPREIELLKTWISQGAKWGQHWSFVRPVRPALPQVSQRDWPRNAIDHFVLERLEQEGLTPSPVADRSTLIRRATLDLTGLPPTPAESAAFIADESHDAYEQLVDRLLASPRYGEQMALPWLDAARYADTSGYQSDGPRHMWRWRDWVIEALNGNLPFDQFTVEQLAGDLLPNATLEQRIASGFNRNHRGNAEGGIIAAEYEVEYVVDRVDTTATVWMGLTLGCTRCHDHKYDPFTQEEFYRLFAYFNSIPEHGRAMKEGNSPPFMAAPTPQQQTALQQAEAGLTGARQRLAKAENDIAAAQAKWEREADPRRIADWEPQEGFVASLSLEKANSHGVTSSEGVRGKGLQFDGTSYLNAGDVGEFGYFDKFTLAAWIRPDDQQGGTILSRMTDEAEGDGYSVVVQDGRIKVLLVKRWLDDALRVETDGGTIAAETWQHVLVTYDGSRQFQGIKIYIDGRSLPLTVQIDALNQTFASKDPLRIGGGNGPASRFHGVIDEVRIFRRVLSPQEAAMLAQRERVADLIAVPLAKRFEAQQAKVRNCFLRQHAPSPLRQLVEDVDAAEARLAAIVERVPNVMVMQELPKPRPAHVLIRGQYDHPGKEVERGVPAALSPFPSKSPNNRLGLARWLVDQEHPLTARVAVNRQWQTFFGAGLVRTPEDFGTQGQRPTHPALLDWLATELVASGWDMKQLHRLIATSATYRQSSRLMNASSANDPDNRLVARGPRVRLTAQALRDQALFASGLLVEQSGGPSVKPYQPPGLWEELANQTYEQGHGTELYRRSLYTYWKRTAASPAMLTFDASDRETCTVRRSRTNTPLQALTLLNEVTFVEAARVLAERVLLIKGSDEDHLRLMFQLAASRSPTVREIEILKSSLDFHRTNMAQQPFAVEALLTQGEARCDSSLDKAEIAAFTNVANLVLNLDEVITKE